MTTAEGTLTWGVGIEHEMHLRRPDGRLSTVSRSFLVDNVLERLEKGASLPAKYDVLTEADRAFLRSGAVDTDLELSGRACAGLSGPREKMFELITRKFQNVTFSDVIREMEQNEARFLEIASKVAGEEVTPYPSGSALLEVEEGDVLKDYTGSYHVTLTLPHAPSMSADAFIAMHRRMANLFQWVEPLLIGILGTPDPSCPGQGRRYPRGSMRINRFGWGTPGCSDVRRLHEGIGRRANHVPAYLKQLKFESVPDYTKTCFLAIETNPSRRLKVNARTVGGLRTDVRTFGLEKQGVRVNMGNFRGVPVPRVHVRGFWNRIKVSGAPMEPGYGMEFRIFDHFPSKYLWPLMSLLALLAEASTATANEQYVQDSPEWNEQIVEMMECGSLASVLGGYWRQLRTVLGLPTSRQRAPRTLFECLTIVHEELLAQYGKGPTFRLLWGGRPSRQRFPNQNAEMWALFYRDGRANDARRAFWDAIGKVVVDLKRGAVVGVSELEKAVPETWDQYDLVGAIDAELRAKTLRIVSKNRLEFVRKPTEMPELPATCEARRSSCSWSRT